MGSIWADKVAQESRGCFLNPALIHYTTHLVCIQNTLNLAPFGGTNKSDDIDFKELPEPVEILGKKLLFEFKREAGGRKA